MMGRIHTRVKRWAMTSALLPGLLLAMVMPGTAAAQAACAPIATGLADPRYVAVTGDGTVYVTEAGVGGTEPLPTPPGAPEEFVGGTRGTTGQVTRIAPGGARSVVAGNLPSYGGMGSVGPAGIAAAGGALWVAVGGPGPLLPLVNPLPNENSVVQINPQTGQVALVADIGAYERANNPDPFFVDSNVYGLAMGTDGNLYAADAGGNALYRVNPATRQLSLVAVIPGLAPPPGFPIPPGGNPGRGGRPELDPVPTGVAAGPDGSIYVGLLSGGPFPPGAAKVLRVSPGGALSDAVTGLTMVQGVVVGPDRMLYVSQLSTNFTAQPPAPGNVVRVRPDGRTEVVVDNLPLAGGITFDAAGNLYVVTNIVTLGPPGAPRQGQVLRCAGVATPALALPRTGTGGDPDGGRAASGLSLPALGAMAAAVAAALAALAGLGGAGALVVRRRAAAGKMRAAG